MKKYFLLSVILFAFATAGAQSFNEYWTNFQKNMKSKDYSLMNISFPYSYSCNYLGDGEITSKQFEKDGTDIFVNGNAFISSTFNQRNYPTNSELKIGKYNGGYLNDYLKKQFLLKFGNLNDIYFVVEKVNENNAVGYKAYFIKINNEFKFIGFEGIEQGD